MLYTKETYHLMRELERSLNTTTDVDFPLKAHDESVWMYCNISGFVVPKFATESDIDHIIKTIKTKSEEHCEIPHVVMQAYIQDVCDESWYWHSIEFEREGYKVDPDEAAD